MNSSNSQSRSELAVLILSIVALFLSALLGKPAYTWAQTQRFGPPTMKAVGSLNRAALQPPR